jgi:chaperonin cofactor prefoldin
MVILRKEYPNNVAMYGGHPCTRTSTEFGNRALKLWRSSRNHDRQQERTSLSLKHKLPVVGRMSSNADNPGTQLAAAVDSRVAQYRKLQEEIQKLETDRQLLMQQQNENEMVKQELALLDGSSQVYKMVGPILLKNDTEDAKQTVNQRLELITGEL